jgi:hypothetical protein
MRWMPRGRNAACAECLDLARELNEAFAGLPQWPKAQSSAQNRSANGERTQPASDALRQLVGGTEEDAERASGLVATYQYQPFYGLPPLPPLAMAALRRCTQHAARTGHFLKRTAN